MGRWVVYVLLCSHWFACLWGLQTVFADSPFNTWKGSFGYCWMRGDESSYTDLILRRPGFASELERGACPCSSYPGGVPHGVSCYVCRSDPQLYVASLYWSLITILGGGNADNAFSPSEQLMALILMLIGSLVWATMIAQVCGTVATLNPEVQEFRRTFDDLNRFMRYHGVPTMLRRRLREYFHRTPAAARTMG